MLIILLIPFTQVLMSVEAWHINSAHAPFNCDDDDGLLSDTYFHLIY